jgi:hypothetical protein
LARPDRAVSERVPVKPRLEASISFQKTLLLTL